MPRVGTALDLLISKKLKRELKPIFVTQVYRTVIPLRLRKGSLVELALDDGQVRAGDKSTSLAEVELELKRGNVTDLFNAAHLVADLVPIKLALKTKSQQGYELIDDQPPRAVHARSVLLKLDASLIDAFQVIGSSALWHFATNEPAVQAGDPEGIHQMRVGVRRLRVAISIFSELLRGEQTDRIKRDLKWLAAKLGPVRDLDVFIQNKVRHLDRTGIRSRGMPELIGELEYRRTLAAEAAKAALASARYRFLVFSTLEWIECGNWIKKSRQGKETISPFAAHLFERRTQKALKKSEHLRRLDPNQRHKLRLTMKTLRYAVYFFESLYDGARRKRVSHYKDCLKDLQDNLGALNDIAVHQKLATKLSEGKEGRAPHALAFAAGVVAGSGRKEVDPLVGKVTKAIRNLHSAKKFWT